MQSFIISWTLGRCASTPSLWIVTLSWLMTSVISGPFIALVLHAASAAITGIIASFAVLLPLILTDTGGIQLEDVLGFLDSL